MTETARGAAKGAGLLAGLAAFGLLAGCADPAAPTPDYYLELPGDPMAAPDYEFHTVDGEPWSFTETADGKLTLLYFGYTSCPDVCPTTMADIADALTRIGEDAERIDVVMVSTDPERDTDEQLGTWLHGFDPEFEGVRGPVDDVVLAARAYGIPVEAPEVSEGDYLVSHGGRIAVLQGGGAAIGFFDEGVSGEQMSALLPDLLAEQG